MPGKDILMFFVEWWNSLSHASQVFYCIAIPSSLVLLIQTLLMFIGLETGADADTDVDIPDADGTADFDLSEMGDLRIFSLRGIIAFLVVFGWVGVVMQANNVRLWLTVLIAAISGFAMMLCVALLLRAVMKLRSNGTADNRNAVGVSGKVYLTIPAGRKGEGKVNIMLQGAYVERNAVTDESDPIPTGSEIIVVGVSGETSLVVKRK